MNTNTVREIVKTQNIPTDRKVAEVYAIKVLKDGWISYYIGESLDVRRRWMQHCKDLEEHKVARYSTRLNDWCGQLYEASDPNFGTPISQVKEWLNASNMRQPSLT